jgi:hypothetical protein
MTSEAFAVATNATTLVNTSSANWKFARGISHPIRALIKHICIIPKMRLKAILKHALRKA